MKIWKVRRQAALRPCLKIVISGARNCAARPNMAEVARQACSICSAKRRASRSPSTRKLCVIVNASAGGGIGNGHATPQRTPPEFLKGAPVEDRVVVLFLQFGAHKGFSSHGGLAVIDYMRSRWTRQRVVPAELIGLQVQ